MWLVVVLGDGDPFDFESEDGHCRQGFTFQGSSSSSGSRARGRSCLISQRQRFVPKPSKKVAEQSRILFSSQPIGSETFLEGRGTVRTCSLEFLPREIRILANPRPSGRSSSLCRRFGFRQFHVTWIPNETLRDSSHLARDPVSCVCR